MAKRNADGTTTEKKDEKTPEQIQKELDDKAAALEVKEKELADKEAALKTTTPITVPQNEPSEEQWVDLEAQYGMPREELRKNHKLIVSIVAPIAAENARLRREMSVDKNVKTAVAELAGKDPQFSKYEKFVHEYLEDVSAEDKADPARLKKQLDKAVFYAKGRAPQAPKKGERELPEVDKNLEEDEEARRSKEEMFGVHEGDGKVIRSFKIKVEKKVPDEYRDKHAHPDGIGILVDERAEWDEGVAQRPRA
jgi:hypothetical protein